MQHKHFVVWLIIMSLVLLTAIPSAAQDDEGSQVFLPLVSDTAQTTSVDESAAVPAAGAVLQPALLNLGTLYGESYAGEQSGWKAGNTTLAVAATTV